LAKVFKAFKLKIFYTQNLRN